MKSNKTPLTEILNYTQTEMKELASFLVGENICKGDKGFIEPYEALWTLKKDFNSQRFITLMKNKEEWHEWFNDEIETLEDIRGAEYFQDLLNNPIREPILITILDDNIYIWDGWHRVAASIISNKTLPVIFCAIK